MGAQAGGAPFDVIVVGAGAAGLAASGLIALAGGGLRVCLVDGADRLGAKILVSGGGRCNLANRSAGPEDFFGGTRQAVSAVLKAFPVPSTLAFFESIGVGVKEEPGGKLFPLTDRASDVLAALVAFCRGEGVGIETGRRVTAIEREPEGGYSVGGRGWERTAAAVLLATGGRSLARTGSDGEGYRLAASLGHRIVTPCPALVPLTLHGDLHRPLAGITQPVVLTLRGRGLMTRRTEGSLLWTHRGISGPPALDVSRHWIRAREQGADPELTASFLPGRERGSVDSELAEAGRAMGRATVGSWLSVHMPAASGEAMARGCGVAPDTRLSQLTSDGRRALVTALLEWPVPVAGHRGWDHAEVTAGGVALDEVVRQTLESRVSPGLFFAGEVLDVDGRLGGFNFQWAWSSAWVAAAGCRQRLGVAPLVRPRA